MVVNPDADFSKISGYVDSLNNESIDSQPTNKLPNIVTQNKEITPGRQVDNSLATKVLPATGISIKTVIIGIITIIILMVLTWMMCD